MRTSWSIAAAIAAILFASTVEAHRPGMHGATQRRALVPPPLDQISAAMPTQVPTNPAPVAPGTKPADLPNAPGLPDLTNWPNGVSYPTPDQPPPTDSPEVRQWIAEVAASGVGVPDIAPFVYADDMCAAPENAPRKGNASECWWTCGHCVRASDVATCTEPLVWGSSFDDGPANYTGDLLLFLDQQKIRTTFFVVASRVFYRPEFLQAQYAAGHQIAVHTWSHTSLTTQTNEQIIAELGWSKKVIQQAIGVTPKYMRPPYGDIDDRVRAISMAMGLTPIIWTVADVNTVDTSFDTFDWRVQAGQHTAIESFSQFNTILSAAADLKTGFIVLEHELWQTEVALAMGYFLPAALSHNPPFKIQSIRECIGVPSAEVYVETASNKGLPPGNGVGGTVTSGSPLSIPGTSSTSITSTSSSATEKQTGGPDAPSVASALRRWDEYFVSACASALFYFFAMF